MMPGQRVDAVFAEIDLVSDRGATVKTHNRTLTPLPSLPNFGRWFIFAMSYFEAQRSAREFGDGRGKETDRFH